MITSRKIQSAVVALFFLAGTWCMAEEQVPAPVDHLLAPPKAADIIAFANDVGKPTDFTGILATLKKEKVMEFLAGGEVKPEDKDRGKWYALADLTLPDAISSRPEVLAKKKQSEQMPNGRIYFNGLISVTGVLATKGGGIFFWKLWNDRVLWLGDETGRACLLVLGPQAKPSAQYLQPHEDPDPATDPAKKLYGKLPKLKSKDILGFCNRPQSGYRAEMRSYITQECFATNLDAGQPIPQLAAFDGNLDPFTFPPNTGNVFFLNFKSQISQQNGNAFAKVTCDGVLVTRAGRLVFWKLNGNRALCMMDDQGHTASVCVNLAYDRSPAACHTQFPIDGKMRLSSIARSVIFQGADWAQGEAPPLDRGKAVQSAWKELSRATGGADASAWRTGSVTTTVLNWTSTHKWYYSVHFINPSTPAAEVVAYVAMDGTAGEINDLAEGTQKMNNMRMPEQEMQQMRNNGWGRGGFGGGFGISD